MKKYKERLKELIVAIRGIGIGLIFISFIMILGYSRTDSSNVFIQAFNDVSFFVPFILGLSGFMLFMKPDEVNNKLE